MLDDLLGPLGGPEEEFSGENPVDRYPLGRLAPHGVDLEPEALDELSGAAASDLVESGQEASAPNVPSLNPSALGFSCRVDGQVTELMVAAKWGRYERVRSEREETAGRTVWRRDQRGGTVRVRLAEGLIDPLPVDPEHPHVVVRGRCRRHEGDWLVSLYVENGQSQPASKRDPSAWIFQVEMSATGPGDEPVFLPRASWRANGDQTDREEQGRLAMAYRLQPQFAVGSGAAVHVEPSPENPLRARLVETRTVPVYEVPPTDIPNPETDEELAGLADLELGMKRLAELSDGPSAALVGALRPLVVEYRAWIDRQVARIDDPREHLAEYAEQARAALNTARRAANRIEAGITLLGRDETARRAFGFANHAMHLQRLHTQIADRRRKEPQLTFTATVRRVEAEDTPRWRPFQLAFMLLNLPALSDPRHPERSEERDQAVADLLWFPTGGGKTEAYLGLTAFTLAARRLQPHTGGLDTSAGLAVLMRYTLRLLTIQQFERAAALICAAETLRRAAGTTWGTAPFRLGLWVGGGVTPNRFDDVEDWLKLVRGKRGGAARGRGTPHQLTSCPWCGAPIEPGQNIEANKTYRRTLIYCSDTECPFGLTMSSINNNDIDHRGLPVLVVDEEIYRHPPSLLIGTVDKFAQLPWRGEATTLFGRVSQRCERHGYVTEDLRGKEWESGNHRPAADAPAARIVGATTLRPPDLIIQDELHLISGPLGSLVGLYETAVDRLATWYDKESGRNIRPKVVASTATVRRANLQIEALFYRGTEVFPPSGLDAGDSFFARQRRPEEKPGRRYVGICAHGSRIKSTLIRVYVSVMGAAQKLHEKYGHNEVTDPYMTLVGYFNSLRDLGGMRRLVEDDVSTRLSHADQRGLASRPEPDVRELTSRLTSDEIRPLLDRLAVPFPRGQNTQRPIDVLLATSMIAVGVDVSRLGLMVVGNQPKSAAEYIQATSRVGRAAPGIVFMVYNWARPRDLSHYERFEHFHGSLYREVEALSVTPFAERAVDRGLTGVLVALTRHLEAGYNGNARAQEFNRSSQVADHVVRYLGRRAEQPADREVRKRVEDEADRRLDHWDRQRAFPDRRLAYEQPMRAKDTAGLLHKPGNGRWHITTCPTSLRDVEPGIQLLLQPPDGSRSADDPPFVPVVKADDDTQGVTA